MSLASYLGLSFPLGLAGLDPAPALIAALYLAHRPGRRRDVYLFGLIITVGTAVWGLLLTALAGTKIQHIPWTEIIHWLLNAGWITLLLKAAIGLCLVGYALYARKNRKSPRLKETKEKSTRGLFFFVLAFLALVTTDIPFAAYIGLSGNQPFWAQVLAFTSWSLIALMPLPPLLLAMAFGQDRWFIGILEKLQQKIKPLITWGIPALCLLLGCSLLLDVLGQGIFQLFT